MAATVQQAGEENSATGAPLGQPGDRLTGLLHDLLHTSPLRHASHRLLLFVFLQWLCCTLPYSETSAAISCTQESRFCGSVGRLECVAASLEGYRDGVTWRTEACSLLGVVRVWVVKSKEYRSVCRTWIVCWLR